MRKESGSSYVHPEIGGSCGRIGISTNYLSHMMKRRVAFSQGLGEEELLLGINVVIDCHGETGYGCFLRQLFGDGTYRPLVWR